MSDGVRLHYRLWIPASSRAAVVVVHGLAEHGGRYLALGDELCRHGIAALVMDLRGHGLSQGTRGYAPSFDRLLEDLEQVRIELLARTGSAQPVFVLGHSMGGLITIRFVQEHPHSFAGAVILSPWLGTALRVPRWKLALADLLALLAPALPIAAGIDETMLSRDPAVVRAYREDPLVHGRITPRLFTEVRRAMEAAMDRAGSIDLPVLLLVAGDDRIVDSGRVRTFAAALRPECCAMEVYEHHRHELLNEPDAADIRSRVRSWLDERIAAPGTGA
ncbi:MAG: lysophospholipase [Gemmatimonadetes bacterium]|nr:lysophospholipase [Gemmatimonadota bacterium]